MSKKYHVSSLTGAPGVCRAKDGNCPYGGKSGQENHYDTFGEAHEASQRLYSKSHDILPENGKFDEEGSLSTLSQLFADIQGPDDEGLASYNEDYDDDPSELLEKIRNHSALKGKKFDNPQAFSKERWEGLTELFNSIQADSNEDATEREIRKEIRTTTDTELLKNVIEGNIYIRDDFGMVGTALQNPNLPREFIDKVLNNPDDYHIETQRWLVTNPALTHKDLMKIVNERDDLEMRTLAMRGSALELSFAKNFLEKNSDEIHYLPWYNMNNNPHIRDEQLFNRIVILGTMRGIKNDELKASSINQRYPDRTREYE